MRPCNAPRPASLVVDRVVAAVLAITAVIAPLPLGSTSPWARFGLEAVAGIVAAVWAAASRRRTSLLLLPLMAAGLAAFQVVPLPDSLLLKLAPISAGAWKEVHAGDAAAWGSIAVDPAGAMAGIRRLFIAVALVGMVASISRDSWNRRIITGAIATSGVFMIALAAAIPSGDKDSRLALGFIDLSGPIWFWKTPVDPPVETAGFSETDWVMVGTQRYVADSWIVGDRVGPYIVSNHYAGGVCLTLPVLVGVWLWFARDRLPFFASTAGALGIAAFGLWTVALIAKSRAGTASLVFALLTLSWLISHKPAIRKVLGGATASLAGLLICGAIALYGPFEWVAGWMPKSFRPAIESLLRDARSLASQLAGRMFAASPFFGTGLGSYYELAGRMLRGSPPWAFAHNDYAQLLAETGVVGGTAAVAAARRLVARGAAFAKQPFSRQTLIDAGPWAAVAGIAAHSFFDWNLHIPANAFLAVLVAGVAVASALQPKDETASSPRWKWLNAPSSGILTGIYSVALICSVAVLGRDARSDVVERSMRAALAQARLHQADPKRPPVTRLIEKRVADGKSWARWDPKNPHLSLYLGQLLLHLADLDSERAASSRAVAQEMFLKAQRCSPVVRGLPEPLPPSLSRPK